MSNDLTVIAAPTEKTCNACMHLRDMVQVGCVPLDPIWGAGPIYLYRSFNCVRFPKEVSKRRTDTCGEFRAAAEPMSDDTEATRKIAAHEAKHGTMDEVIARGFNILETMNKRHAEGLASAYATINANEKKKKKDRSILGEFFGLGW